SKIGRMSLDKNYYQTLRSINEAVEKLQNLLQIFQLATLIVAVAIAFLLVGTTITCYYGKYKKYNNRRR
ncbi:hypothetical protein PMAYCL1PPCAC_32306, partial [Pristionchus mayeri]